MLNILKVLNSTVLILFFLITFSCNSQGNSKPDVDSLKSESNELDSIPFNVKKLIASYENIVGYEDNYIIFSDGSKMIYDDKKNKTLNERLRSPDIEDMFVNEYKHWDKGSIPKFYNPGRVRNDELFKKIYGSSKEKVREKLVKVKWCPKLANKDVLITSVNNVHLKLDSLSKELDNHPEFKKYVQNIGGTFNWRVISGTKRMSAHSYGIAIDINVKYSNYWQWDCNCKDENADLVYKNKIPIELVVIFEKYGFIWGGNWYNYDTMHFEYRPELL